jgi:pyruvate dehydrogenase E2 component (dihydrolipoamide acetyltransferase)
MATKTHDGTMFVMPSLGADMAEGRITEWLVQPGDHVERGQIVVIVETDKSDIEVEVFEPATVIELLADHGDVVPVGRPIAVFQPAGLHGDTTKRPATPRNEEPDTTGTPRPVAAPGPAPTTQPRVGDAAAHVTSPVIRHLVDELHVDPRMIQGTGPGGRVHRDDVEAAAATTRRPRITPRARRLMRQHGIDPITLEAAGYVTGDDVLALAGDRRRTARAPAAEQPTKADKMRTHIAELMTRSWAEIPHFHLAKRIDLGALTERLVDANEARPLADRVVPGALLLCAASRAAAKVPACNGWWIDGRFRAADDVRLGVVLSLRSGGILVPTIDRADELTPFEMMERLTELVQRARQGRLRASDMSEATITVTNLGDLGADSVAGVIHPPQVALVGFGAVHEELSIIDGMPAIRPVVHASLAGDHRAIDGLTGSRYLAQLQSQLAGPLLEELS